MNATEEEQFISLIFENNLLWDRKNPFFLNSNKKSAIWECIGKQFNLVGIYFVDITFKNRL